MDDLTRPLGQTSAREPASRAPRLLVPLVAGILFLPVAIFAGWAIFMEDRLGGEPIAAVEITAGTTAAGSSSAQTSVMKIVSPLASSAAEQPALRSNRQTVTIIDGSSGRRDDVLVPNTATVPLPAQPRRSK